MLELIYSHDCVLIQVCTVITCKVMYASNVVHEASVSVRHVEQLRAPELQHGYEWWGFSHIPYMDTINYDRLLPVYWSHDIMCHVTW